MTQNGAMRRNGGDGLLVLSLAGTDYSDVTIHYYSSVNPP